MVLEIYSRTKDRDWLGRAVHALEDYYRYWTREPHLTSETGLTRYDGGADTPAPEVLVSESDIHGRNDYDRIRRYFHHHQVHSYDMARFYDRSTGDLTPEFYRADRAMRESGFDPSSRFGPFSAAILDYNPVDLNSLLCRMENEIAAIQGELDQEAQAAEWRARAKRRAEAINELMWDEKAGQYFDYNFRNQRRSGYPFLTTFYPLWAGIASPAQAARIAQNIGPFERPGGLQTSTHRSGDQWDAPFGWAPLQLIAVEGLRRYGFDELAEQVSVRFLSMVIEDFRKTKTIREKYDVNTRRSDLSSGLKFGYSSNEIGFGWTNGVFEALYVKLSPNALEHLTVDCQNREPLKPARPPLHQKGKEVFD
jgi:alpha,alpha-trehalase